MPDLGWLADAGKLVGGGLIGWMGRVFAERDKRRKVRRRLYRELILNYLRVKVGIEYVTGLPAEGRSWDGDLIAFVPLSTDYYEHARKDMDVYVELKEGFALDTFYRRAADYNAAVEHDVAELPGLFLHLAIRMCEMVESEFAHGTFDLKLAKRLMHKNHFDVLAEGVRSTPTQIEQMKAAVEVQRAMMQAEADAAESPSTD